MSRKIKFKVWDKVNKCLYHSPQLVIRPYSGNVTDGAILLSDIQLLQYTGFKINCAEIYEGDLLEFAYIDIDGERYSSLYEVVFKDGCFMSKFLSQIRPEYETLSEFLNVGENETLKVIGNIYEKHELLEV